MRVRQNDHVSYIDNYIIYTYVGTSEDDLQRQFYEDMKEIQSVTRKVLDYNCKMIMTTEDKKDYIEATTCHICEQDFKEPNNETIEKIRAEQLEIIKEADKLICEGELEIQDGNSKVEGGRLVEKKGNERVTEGTSVITEGKSLKKKGRQQVKEGKCVIKEGRQKVMEGKKQAREGASVVKKGTRNIREGKRNKRDAELILSELKVRDHDHFNGKYRGAAHSKCNLSFNFKNFKLPVFIHNLKGYDEHPIINAFGKYGKYVDKKEEKYTDDEGNTAIRTIIKEKEMRLECIPSSEEVYLTMRIGNMQFKDSFGFQASSLEVLADNLLKSKGEDAFKCTKAVFGKMYGDKWKMLLRKGVYPYEYMSDFNKFKETCLPSRESFYS